jgi:hypothetical protein
MQIKKSNANAFMLAVLISITAVVVINFITALIGLPALIMCSAFLLFTASIAVMVEQKNWVFLIIICLGMCIIITGVSWQAGLTL